jgi:phage gp36-like protein
MSHATPSPRPRQVKQRRQQFQQTVDLPFAQLLDHDTIQQALREEQVFFRDRLFSPFVTLWVFLSQVLAADQCCRAALTRFCAWRAAQQLPPCSPDPSAYCRARGRLPEGVLRRLTRVTGRRVHGPMPAPWLWNGHPLKVVDGTTASMPDTEANQQEYPQPNSQKPGLGFPLVRMVVLFSLTVGTVLDAALGRYQGKQTGETALFHTLQNNLEKDDILLADRYYSSYWEIAFVQQRGADMVCRVHQRRRVDFRRGRRLGTDDHVVTWSKPARPEWLDEATYALLPDTLTIREVRVHVAIAGFRTKVLVVATTLLDPVAMPPSDVALLYRLRWYAELDLRALKQTLQMDILRGQTPEMVRKEIWAHLLAYNLIREQMAVAAREQNLYPVQLSFKGAVQAVNAFTGGLWTVGADERAAVCQRLRDVIASYQLEERPNRSEPRARKRRPKKYPFLNEPRRKKGTRLAEKTCG